MQLCFSKYDLESKTPIYKKGFLMNANRDRIMSRPSAGQIWLLLNVPLILKVKTIGFNIFYLNKFNIILYSIDIVEII